MTSSNQVALVGYAQSAIERHAGVTLGALTIETTRQAIADAGLEVSQVDGFVTASLFPTAGAHAAVDGVSLVSANWLAQHLGVHSGLRRRLPGLRATSRRDRHGGQCNRQWSC